MEIRKIKISKIVPSEYNPRVISDAELIKLTNSLELESKDIYTCLDIISLCL